MYYFIIPVGHKLRSILADDSSSGLLVALLLRCHLGLQSSEGSTESGDLLFSSLAVGGSSQLLLSEPLPKTA